MLPFSGCACLGSGGVVLTPVIKPIIAWMSTPLLKCCCWRFLRGYGWFCSWCILSQYNWGPDLPAWYCLWWWLLTWRVTLPSVYIIVSKLLALLCWFRVSRLLPYQFRSYLSIRRSSEKKSSWRTWVGCLRLFHMWVATWGQACLFVLWRLDRLGYNFFHWWPVLLRFWSSGVSGLMCWCYLLYQRVLK